MDAKEYRPDLVKPRMDYFCAVVEAYPALRAELLAAREVCEAASSFDAKHQTSFDGQYALRCAIESWRAARNGGGTT